MSATEKLRVLLNERGVEYYPKRSDVTVWSEGVWHIHAQDDMIDGRLELFIRPVTPEQAIAATLGKGECEFCKDGKFDRQTVMMSNHGWQRINYCPNCGRKVRA